MPPPALPPPQAAALQVARIAIARELSVRNNARRLFTLVCGRTDGMVRSEKGVSMGLDLLLPLGI